MKRWTEIPACKGFLTGMLLQLAIGPVFFYVLGITLSSDFLTGLSGIVAVTLVDCLYIALSLLGLGKLLEKDRLQRLFARVSSVILIGFGIQFAWTALILVPVQAGSQNQTWTALTSFISCFMLTVSSPLTIFFWGSIFSTKACENGYDQRQLIHFAGGAGLATLIFLASTMFVLSLFRTTIPGWTIQVLNLLVGLVLVAYGVSRLLKARRHQEKITPTDNR